MPTLVIAALLLWPRLSDSAGDEHRVKVETGVIAKMRDGVALTADVYRPADGGRFPTLLQRTPYDRRGEVMAAYDLAAAGYVVIVQDVRGRYGSEGEFDPFRHEAEDGYDSVEWAASLPWSDGRVGMFGGSYVGATQMLAAMAMPPHLVAVSPTLTASEYYEGWTYQGGALMQLFTSSWASQLAIDTLGRKATAALRPQEWVRGAPVEAYPLLEVAPPAELAPYYRDWIAHEASDEYWRAVKVSDHYGQMAIKGLHTGGWHDIFLMGSIQNFIGLRGTAATPEARRDQRLLLGPWAHAPTSPEGKIGDVVFGQEAVPVETERAWFDYALKGVSNEYATQPPVRLFVMGENAWRYEDEFPLARARTTRYYLHAGRDRSAGSLRLERPGRSPAATYEYDPEQPAPTLGGRLCCGDFIPRGPYDQRPLESRPDVLVFSTPPLERDVEVTGFVGLELHAASSAVDTDFTAILADVEPGGYARFLTDGILRARYRNSTSAPEPIVPGQIYKYSIDLWATSNLFRAGHRMRLYVSSSNFPRFDRNRNTGEAVLGATRSIKARQTVFLDRDHPSALVLPIVPR
ncbi:MAG TPA: CocE/NonD family hydrolase [Vicinamibacteria bacterium]|nr:CocE/NonD family hydrolase [Vicinamibacteria bacterium]